MLVLSRKMGQKLQIGNNITVTVLKTQGNTIRLGIEAPRDVSVRRAELPPLTPAKEGKSVHSPATVDITTVRNGLARNADHSTSDVETHGASTDRSPASNTKQGSHPNRWSVNNMEQRVRTAQDGKVAPAPLASKIASL